MIISGGNIFFEDKAELLEQTSRRIRRNRILFPRTQISITSRPVNQENLAAGFQNSVYFLKCRIFIMYLKKSIRQDDRIH